MEFVDDLTDQQPVRLVAEGDDVVAWAGDRRLATVHTVLERQRFTIAVDDYSRCDRELAAQLVAAVRRLGGPTPALDSPNPVVRDEARRGPRSGGGLRVPLLAGAGSHPTAAPAGAEALGTAISELTGLAVSGRSSSGAARRVLSSARFGLADISVLMVADPTLQISVPIGDDLMPENVAGFVIMSRHKAKRPGNRPAAAVRSGFTALDGTVAHEAWHQNEAGFAARRLADRTELRRQLGLSLGVETLEQAIKGGHHRAPEHWQAAHARLRQLVSPYATTNPIEATAEMFKLWWCRISNSVVDRFGELLGELFGVAAR